MVNVHQLEHVRVENVWILVLALVVRVHIALLITIYHHVLAHLAHLEILSLFV